MRASAATLAMTVGVAGGLAHAGPALSWLPSVRRHLPGLDGQGQPGTIALTFDDGPDPASTPALLDVLADLEVHATFFLLGEMVQRAPSLVRELTAAGHEVGLHGWHHRNSFRVAPVALRESLRKATDLIEEQAGQEIRWYRPPYGVVTAGNMWAARTMGLRTVLWGSWGQDWSPTATPATVLASVRKDLRPGGTVLLHDSDCTSAPGAWRSMLGAIRPLVEDIRTRGLRTATLGQHLR